MANAKRDGNNQPTLLCVSSANGSTLVNVQVNPANNAISASDASTGSDFGPTRALRDENFVTTLIGVSSVDGVTPVAVYADNTGKLLIDHT